MKEWWLLLAFPLLVGCTNPMMVQLHNGTFCSAANVEAYAKRNNLTYEQSLNELRKKSDDLWSQQAAEPSKTAETKVPTP